MVGFFHHLRFVEHHCLLYVFESSSGSNKKHGLWGLSEHHFLITEVTRLLVLALGLSELPFPLMAGPSEVCTQGNITNPIQWVENQWVETPLVSVSLLLHMLH